MLDTYKPHAFEAHNGNFNWAAAHLAKLAMMRM